MIKRTALLLLLLMKAGALVYSTDAVTFQSDLPEEELTEALLDGMSDEDLLGQVLMLGYMGERASETILDWISDRKIGGIKVFGWNANDLSVLADTIGTMQKAALDTPLGIPLIIATDQEGGWVRHVKGETSITPGNMAIGASGLLYDAYQTGYLIGMEMRSLGINMNFAPTVDVYLNPLAEVIGPRAFSDNPVQTGLLGTAFFKGMDDVGVISTAKHFPGHGNAEEDSHGTLPHIPSDRDFLEAHDLIPYNMMIREGLPAIMAGHLAFPNITGNTKPASLCPIFLREILRKEMGYEGLVITDDLVMQGARYGNKSLAEICEEALRAGNDFLLVSRNPGEHEKIWNHLLPLIKTDEDFRHLVRQSARRVITTKIQYLKRENAVPLIPEYDADDQTIPASGSGAFIFDQALRGTTLIRKSQIPLPEQQPLLIAGLYSEFRRTGKEFFPRAETMRIPHSFDTETKWSLIDTIKESSKKYDHIVFSLSRHQDLRILKELESLKDKIIILSSLTPVYLNEIPWVEDAVAVYGTGKESFVAGFGAIRGDFVPQGRLPMPLKD